MKSFLKYTFLLFAFWLLLFFCHRLFFVIYQLPIANKIVDHSDIYKAYYKGYLLDISTASMLMLLPLLLSMAYFIFQKEIFKKLIFFVIGFFILLYSSIAIGDAGLYKEWNAKINMQAIEHFKNPDEVFRTISLPLIILFFLLLSIFLFPFILMYKKFIEQHLPSSKQSSFTKRAIGGLLYFIISGGIAVVLIRGGIDGIPINQSIAYFSHDALANDIAVNPFYSLLQDASIKSNIPDTSVYKFRSTEDARNLIADDFQHTGDSSLLLFKEAKPNLVVIFLESWSADNIAVLGGLEDCTPQFNALSKEGLLCTQAYSNAYVSDQGIPAILSATPSVSRVAIINQPSKVHDMPCISEDLSKLGYRSSFMFGGDLIYGNIRGYLLEKNFTHLVEQKDFPHLPQGRLGVHDEYTFKELLNAINKQQGPFLQCFFTSSTHMPYDYKPTDQWQSSAQDAEKKYTESCHYSDSHLGNFFKQAKLQEWYKHTLFIVVADHSHNSIKQWPSEHPKHSHIPLLFLGGALKDEWIGKTWNKKVSQLDIAATLLSQFHLDTHHYPYSRNMFNPSTSSAAYYIFFGGQGYINDQGFAASHQGNPHISTDLKDSTIIQHLHDKAMSFQQLIYEGIEKKK